MVGGGGFKPTAMLNRYLLFVLSDESRSSFPWKKAFCLDAGGDQVRDRKEENRVRFAELSV